MCNTGIQYWKDDSGGEINSRYSSKQHGPEKCILVSSHYTEVNILSDIVQIIVKVNNYFTVTPFLVQKQYPFLFVDKRQKLNYL